MDTMKRESVNTPNTNQPKADASMEDWKQEDPVWDLLGKASTREPSAFFARNVIREARLLGTPATSWVERMAGFFTPTKLTIGAAACACALAVYQMWPSADSVGTPNPIVQSPVEAPASALSELVIVESLAAAAEDPSIFTRDEVVAMIGF